MQQLNVLEEGDWRRGAVAKTNDIFLSSPNILSAALDLRVRCYSNWIVTCCHCDI